MPGRGLYRRRVSNRVLARRLSRLSKCPFLFIRPRCARRAGSQPGCPGCLFHCPTVTQEFSQRSCARLGVFLLTIYPNNIAYTSFILTEIYFTFLLLLGAYLYIARRGWIWLFLSSLVFGLATLTKPQIIFLPVLLVLLQFISRKEKARPSRCRAKGLAIYLNMAMCWFPGLFAIPMFLASLFSSLPTVAQRFSQETIPARTEDS